MDQVQHDAAVEFDQAKTRQKIMLSATVRGARLRAGLKQSDVADRSGVTQRTICMLEAPDGANCSMDTFLSVMQVLGMRMTIEPDPTLKHIQHRADEMPRRIIDDEAATPMTP